MKAIIKNDFLNMFLYEEDINKEKDFADVDWENIKEWKKGDIVEIVKVVDNFYKEEDCKEKGYVIYNPKNHESITVGGIFLNLIEE